MQLANLQAEIAEQINHQQTDANVKALAPSWGIYCNKNLNSLMTHLKNHFPLTAKILGDDFFLMTCKHYIAQYPSRHPSLIYYGEFFSDFLVEFAPIKNMVFLPELALFEWTCQKAQYSIEAAQIDLSQIPIIKQDQYAQTYFQIDPACHFLHSHFPLLDIIQQIEKGNKQIEHHGASNNLLIRYQNETVQIEEIGEDNLQLLTDLQDGLSLQEALENTFAINASYNLNDQIAKWLCEQVIVGVEIL